MLRRGPRCACRTAAGAAAAAAAARRWGEGVDARDVLKVYLVTDDAFRENLEERVRGCIAGGVRCVQVRLKTHSTAEYVELTRDVVRLARPHGVKIIVDDRADVCIAADADGVHVGRGDLPPDDARRVIGDRRILGVTVYGEVPRMLAALDAGADYVGSGAIFPSTTKPSAAHNTLPTLTDLRATLAARPDYDPARLPIVAIGGITPENAHLCLRAGADGVAMVSGLLAGAPDVNAYDAAYARTQRTFASLLGAAGAAVSA